MLTEVILPPLISIYLSQALRKFILNISKLLFYRDRIFQIHIKIWHKNHEKSIDRIARMISGIRNSYKIVPIRNKRKNWSKAEWRILLMLLVCWIKCTSIVWPVKWRRIDLYIRSYQESSWETAFERYWKTICLNSFYIIVSA